MNQNNIDQFKVAYDRFKGTEEYQKRISQSVLTPLFREIIQETLKNDPLLNKHLTGLIQMFKYNCQPQSFKNYLSVNVQDANLRVKFQDRFIKSGNTGYTGAGLSSVNRLSELQLREVKVFLLQAFDVSDEGDAIRLCTQFDQLNIPHVKSGIYSPWLHYINPKLFPLSNNSHSSFRNWIGMQPDYPSCIRDFNQLARMVGENDLGCIDFCAHLMKIDADKSKQIKISGHHIFKISMSPAINEVDKDTFQYCLEQKIIIMGGSTKAIGTSKISQNELFRSIMKVGDYFYLCRGNEGVILLGQITGGWSDFSLESFRHKHWIQRPYTIIAENQEKSTPYQKEKKHWTPNFNSTFIRIPENEIEMANNLIFKPYFKTEFLPQSQPQSQSQSPLNLILYGPPGTGKTYHTVNEALKIISPDFDFTQPRNEVKKEFNRLVEEGRIVFATFHQSMSYEDFVEGIKPINNEKQDLLYEISPGVFKQISTLAMDNWLAAKSNTLKQLPFEESFARLKDEWEENPEMSFPLKREGNEFTITDFTSASIRFKKASGGTSHTLSISTLSDAYYELRALPSAGLGIYYPSIIAKLRSYSKATDNSKEMKPFVLIIDEINRGNVSQIFGELITLIEADKRAGKPEALEVVLPYSKQKFSIPPNLHIIGTMNTADRSVEALDTALRRRFSFKEMPPQPELIRTEGELKAQDGKIGDIDVVKMLETINQRIERLIDHDHCIGHSYFMQITSKEDLKIVFKDKVIPLLQEYFFGDFGKIGLVLGKSFVTKIAEKQVFAPFDDYGHSRQDLEERPVYKIQHPENWDFPSIYL